MGESPTLERRIFKNVINFTVNDVNLLKCIKQILRKMYCLLCSILCCSYSDFQREYEYLLHRIPNIGMHSGRGGRGVQGVLLLDLHFYLGQS